MDYTPENIDGLFAHEVFVFGSNLAGRHGRGAALTAHLLFGAERGVGCGPTGQCYALPTKDEQLKVLPLETIDIYIRGFYKHVRANPSHLFLVTKVGCGLAGYTAAQMGPLFRRDRPPNVVLPKEFL